MVKSFKQVVGKKERLPDCYRKEADCPHFSGSKRAENGVQGRLLFPSSESRFPLHTKLVAMKGETFHG
jgi:hypothetical protein